VERVVPLITKNVGVVPGAYRRPLLELEEQEFGTLPVTTVVGAPAGSDAAAGLDWLDFNSDVPPSNFPVENRRLALVLWTSTPTEWTASKH